MNSKTRKYFTGNIILPESEFPLEQSLYCQINENEVLDLNSKQFCFFNKIENLKEVDLCVIWDKSDSKVTIKTLPNLKRGEFFVESTSRQTINEDPVFLVLDSVNASQGFTTLRDIFAISLYFDPDKNEFLSVKDFWNWKYGKTFRKVKIGYCVK